MAYSVALKTCKMGRFAATVINFKVLSIVEKRPFLDECKIICYTSLREMYPNTELFLIQIQENTDQK